MRATKKKSIAFLMASLLSLALATPNSAVADATQADVDYSTKVSALVLEFSNVAADWGTAVSSPPTLAFGSKWTKYKKAATKSTNAFLATIAKMAALVPSEGFPKSGPMLQKSCAAYKTAISTFNTGIQKNDSKIIAKANTLASKATTSYLAWSKAYASEVAALNG